MAYEFATQHSGKLVQFLFLQEVTFYIFRKCKFERPFKIQKNGVFLFEISFFVLEILTFFYYANQISDDVILFATKNGKMLNKRYLWKYCSSVLETWHHKCASQKKQNEKKTPKRKTPFFCILKGLSNLHFRNIKTLPPVRAKTELIFHYAKL